MVDIGEVTEDSSSGSESVDRKGTLGGPTYRTSDVAASGV